MSATVRRYEGIDKVRSEEVTRKVSENLLDETLCDHVDELILSHKFKPLLSTTGSRAFIEELAARIGGLEEAIREIALEVQEAAASPKGISEPANAEGGDRLLGTVSERFSLTR